MFMTTKITTFLNSATDMASLLTCQRSVLFKQRLRVGHRRRATATAKRAAVELQLQDRVQCNDLHATGCTFLRASISSFAFNCCSPTASSFYFKVSKSAGRNRRSVPLQHERHVYSSDLPAVGCSSYEPVKGQLYNILAISNRAMM